MKAIKLGIIATFICCFLLSCASLKAPIIKKNESLTAYRYFYLTSTNEITSGSGTIYGKYGATTTKTLVPGDVISGYMIKNGFVRLPELKQELLDQTLIINYGESGRRNLNLGYTIEVTIQMLSAKTNAVVCVCTAEGQGSTEADDIRIAINRALDGLFK